MKHCNAYFILFSLLLTTMVKPDDVVRLIEKTGSGSLLRLNMGEKELKPKDSALLVAMIKQDSSGVKYKRKYLPLGKVFLIGAGARNSIWYLDSKYRKSKLLKVGASYLLLIKRNFLLGKTNRKTSVLNITARGRGSLNDENILFKKRQQDFNSIKLHLDKWLREETHREIRVSKWVRDLSQNAWGTSGKIPLISKASISSKPGHDLSKISRLEVYEKSLVSFLKKMNDPKTSWEDRLQKEKEYVDQSEGVSQKVTQKEKDLLASRRKIEGIDWSKSFSQDELMSWVENYGAITELGVRKQIDRYSLIGSLHASVGINLASNELASDFQNTRNFKASFEGSAEWFLFRSFENYLRNISLEFSARLALDALATGAANALTQETSTAIRAFWYPVGPYRMEKNIFFIGPVLRLGIAQFEVNRTQESGSYTAVGAGVSAGYRYSFLSGLGARVLLSYEQISFQSSNRSEPIVHLENKLSLSDFRIQIGLSYVF